MTCTDEQALLDRLRKIEALFSRTDVAGERDAAAQAMAGILEQLRRIERSGKGQGASFPMPQFV